MTTDVAHIRVLVDLTRLAPGGENGGIKPAVRGILRWIGSQKDAADFIYLVDPPFWDECQSWLRPNDRCVASSEAARDLALRENCALVYCPLGSTNWACPGIPVCTLIVDLLHRDYPESLGSSDVRHRDERFKTALVRTDLFQVISDFTAGQLREHYQGGTDRLVRTYLPVHRRPDRKSGLRGKYFFYPANGWIHKNHETLLVAFGLYAHCAGAQAWKLVLTGCDGERKNQLERRTKAMGLDNQVELRGHVSESELAAIWTGAEALVFPSLHEGFGIPLLEAFAWEVPVLASNATAIPEVAEEAALYFNGRSPTELAQAMHRISTEPELRATLASKGLRRLSNFSPETEFGRLWRAWQQIANCSARWRRTGYYPVDGLTDPIAIFALNSDEPNSKKIVSFTIQPLGVKRIAEFWNGSECVGQIAVSAHSVTTGEIVLPSGTRALIIKVPDAASLSPTDPRTHGIILEKLTLRGPGDIQINLLYPEFA